MIDRHYIDPAERVELTEQDLTALIGRYVARREHNETPCAHDLLAAAAEFGDAAGREEPSMPTPLTLRAARVVSLE